jgi:hypothetical protein
MTWVHLTPKSANAKTGPIPVSTTEADTCPPDCPWRAKVCYAKHGPQGLHWRAVSAHKRGMPWDSFCGAIAALPAGTLWRHNASGDLPGQGAAIDAAELRALVAANRGRRGFTYTHKRGAENLALIREANAGGFVINLSADTLAQADTLADTGAGPVCVVLPEETRRNTQTPAGRRVVICPATQREDVTCQTCRLCAQGARTVVVGFPAHGTGRKGVAA